MFVSLCVCVYSERPAVQPPVCSSTSHVLAPFRRWASANIDALHEAEAKTKQNKKKTKQNKNKTVSNPRDSSRRRHWGAAASHYLPLSLSAPPPQMHLGIQCRLIPLTSEDPRADALCESRGNNIMKNSKQGETRPEREDKHPQV